MTFPEQDEGLREDAASTSMKEKWRISDRRHILIRTTMEMEVPGEDPMIFLS